FRLVLPWVAVVVALVAVRIGDDERRAFTGTRTCDRVACGRVDRPHVAPVHVHPGHPVTLGALRDVLDRDRALHRQAFGVLVVFADVDRRQLPDRGQVQRFVAGALVGSAVAEDRDRDLVGPELLRRERGAGRHGDPPAPGAGGR